MGRSKFGGCRSFLRGKVGPDIYQCRLDSNGKRVQIVKAAETSRQYSNTEAQAKARMIMGQIQRMFHLLPDIIRSGFEGVPEGAMSFQKFAKLNYPLLRNDLDNNWSVPGSFDWRPKRQMTAPAGEWILTQGDYSAFHYDSIDRQILAENSLVLYFKDAADWITFGDVLSSMNLNITDQIFLFYFIQDMETRVPSVQFTRFRVNPNLSISTMVDDISWDSVFLPIGNKYIEAIGDFLKDGRFELQFTQFADYSYVVPCFGFMVVNYDQVPTRFSSLKFSWLVDTSSFEFRRWYNLLTPDIAFTTWFQD